MMTKEKNIAISQYPLLQTEFLYASKKGLADRLLELQTKNILKVSLKVSFVFHLNFSMLKHVISMKARRTKDSIIRCSILGRV